MSKHSPEPWVFSESRQADGIGYIESDGKDIHHAGVFDLPNEVNRANGQRLVACVNFMAGVPDVEIEACGTFFQERERTAAATQHALGLAMNNGAANSALRAERDALLADMKVISEWSDSGRHEEDFDAIGSRARVALSRGAS